MQGIKSAAQTTSETRLTMNYDEYLEFAGDSVMAEWVDGEVIVHMPPTDEHQRLAEFFERLLAIFVGLRRLGLVRNPPFEVRLTAGGPSREPDIFFLSTAHADRLTSKRLDGPPDLVVEVISPDSVSRDRSTKFREYEAAGVREYWIVDSREGVRRADLFVLDATGRYELVATEADERMASTVLPGFWLRPDWLWQEPAIEPLTALAQIVGVDALIAHLQQTAPPK